MTETERSPILAMLVTLSVLMIPGVLPLALAFGAVVVLIGAPVLLAYLFVTDWVLPALRK